MEYKKLDERFRTAFFELNSNKSNKAIRDSIIIKIRAIDKVSEKYNRIVEAYNFNLHVDDEIFFVKSYKELINLKNGDRIEKIKNYAYKTAKVIKVSDTKILLEHEDGKRFTYNITTILEVSCWKHSLI